jgi:hypothetical protein
VSPLAGLPLRRLVLSPSRIKKGLDLVRNIVTLEEIGTFYAEPEKHDLAEPAAFWQRYDAGQLK